MPVPVLALLLAAFALPAQADGRSPEAGEPGGPGLALRCAKALTCARSGPQWHDRAMILVRDGLIEAVGPEREVAPDGVPHSYELLDAGELWAVPGLIDLHSHVGGSGDLNDMVFQANPELRIKPAVVPGNANISRALSAGVTTVLFIPGSGTTIGGQGVLLKTAGLTWDEMLLRDPGSLKVAQADNPVRWGYGMGRGMLNWQIRDVLSRGLDWAREREAGRVDPADDPEHALMFEIFPALLARRAQVSVHTQVYQVVYATLRILVGELGLDAFIDHGEFDAFLLGEMADSMGSAAILGPRSISTYNPGRGVDHDGRIMGLAAGWQEHGHRSIGFNTDAPVVPAEELFLQAAMGVRFGFDDGEMQSIRGLTIVPAITAGIADRLGSLEPGKQADLALYSGDPVDPRSRVELVLVGGRRAWEPGEGPRAF